MVQLAVNCWPHQVKKPATESSRHSCDLQTSDGEASKKYLFWLIKKIAGDYVGHFTENGNKTGASCSFDERKKTHCTSVSYYVCVWLWRYLVVVFKAALSSVYHYLVFYCRRHILDSPLWFMFQKCGCYKERNVLYYLYDFTDITCLNVYLSIWLNNDVVQKYIP